MSFSGQDKGAPAVQASVKGTWRVCNHKLCYFQDSGEPALFRVKKASALFYLLSPGCTDHISKAALRRGVSISIMRCVAPARLQVGPTWHEIVLSSPHPSP